LKRLDILGETSFDNNPPSNHLQLFTVLTYIYWLTNKAD